MKFSDNDKIGDLLNNLPKVLRGYELNILWIEERDCWCVSYNVNYNLYSYDTKLVDALAKMWLLLQREGHLNG